MTELVTIVAVVVGLAGLVGGLQAMRWTLALFLVAFLLLIFRGLYPPETPPVTYGARLPAGYTLDKPQCDYGHINEDANAPHWWVPGPDYQDGGACQERAKR